MTTKELEVGTIQCGHCHDPIDVCECSGQSRRKLWALILEKNDWDNITIRKHDLAEILIDIEREIRMIQTSSRK